MRGPISDSACSGSMQRSSWPPISAKTGVAPAWITVAAVATKVNEGTITSSPGPTPAQSSAR